MQQLDLKLEFDSNASLSDFAGPSWLSIIDAVRQLHMGLLKQCYLYGGNNTGKTHLLNAICNSYEEVGSKAIRVSLKALTNDSPDVVMALQNFQVVALDDLDAIASDIYWQEAIFHLINRCIKDRCQLIFASTVPVLELGFSFDDLISRLHSAPSFRLPDANLYEDRQAILYSTLSKKGWLLDERVIVYLLDQPALTIGKMIDILERIDHIFRGKNLKKLSNANFNQIKRLIDQQS